MKAARYSASRQKACRHCSTAKVKCERKAGRCARCDKRGLSCDNTEALPSPGSTSGRSHNTHGTIQSPELGSATLPTPRTPGLGLELEQPTGANVRTLDIQSPQSYSNGTKTSAAPVRSAIEHTEIDPRSNTTKSVYRTPEQLDFSKLELLCPINANDISNRWLNTYIPIPGQTVKNYPPAVTNLIYKILKSYATAAVRGRGLPPFIHPQQMTAASAEPPLATCLTVVRICEKLHPGSEKVAAEILQREMMILYEEHGKYDDAHDDAALLAAFQAYLIYSMVLFFTKGQDSNSTVGQDSEAPLRQALMDLQNLASLSSLGGLICTVEQQRARPRWEAWIVTEAKRRTLFTMYLFDSLLSAQANLPTFLGTELLGLPAPMNKVLWRSGTRKEWETAYNLHLSDWPQGGLHIEELWPSPQDFDEHDLMERRNRVDQWLENVDEFGTMLYTVASCTHNN